MALVGRKENLAQTILDRKLLRILAPLTNDTNTSVKHSAVGALRNISLANPTICEQMIDQDVLTPIQKLFQSNYDSEWSPDLKAKVRFFVITFLHDSMYCLSLFSNYRRETK